MINSLPRIMIEPAIAAALREDLGIGGDATSRAVVPAGLTGRAVIRSRAQGVVSGIDVARCAFSLMDRDLTVTAYAADGDFIAAGDDVLAVEGCLQSILTAERVALNFMGRMCGIASLTADMIARASPHTPKISCTRKTTPNLRMFEKYAVRCGGGTQHRLALDDCIMIKDNHIAVNGGDIAKTLTAARAYAGHTTPIEIEVDTLDQLQAVFDAGGADIILLDNMSPALLKQAVNITDGRAVLEASGGISRDTVQAVAASGVDVISIGALTHSAGCLDLGLDFD